MKKLSPVKYYFEHLRRQREYVEKVCKAVKDVTYDAKVYVIGSVAMGLTTKLSVEILEKAIEDSSICQVLIASHYFSKIYNKHFKKSIKIKCNESLSLAVFKP